MSREFGDYAGGMYMHAYVDSAADDCAGGRGPVTALLGGILRTLYPLAYAVSSHEACDSGPDRPLFAAIEGLPEIKRAVAALEAHVEPYRLVAEAAVREAARR